MHTYKRAEDRESRRESRGVPVASRLALGASVSRDSGFPFWGSAFVSTFRLAGVSTSGTSADRSKHNAVDRKLVLLSVTIIGIMPSRDGAK